MPMNVLIVAAHPDDEVLGCGGTLARHAAEGDSVNILIVAEGATSRMKAGGANVDNLKLAAKRAAKVLGAKAPHFLGFPDNRLDSAPLLEIIHPIEKLVEKFSPDIVYTHHGGDLNVDHRIVHRAVVTACRPVPGSSALRLYAFETLSSTEWANSSIGPTFTPTHFVGIADQLEAKLRALQCYDCEMRPAPHPRSLDAVRALAVLRGCHVGIEAAEAFETVLDIVR